jgi:methylated-DNA-protein-cysteine methyltransferase-like protein
MAKPQYHVATPWVRAIETVVRSIPPGHTLSYAKVALLAGKPGAARAVAQALGRCIDIPWWRVVRSDGTLAEAVAARQAAHLRAEGVAMSKVGAKKRVLP